MHDTANRWLFTEGSRNFSHGCIRLQNPLDFVEKNWMEETWTRGCYVGVMGPGVMTAWGAALRAPCGRIHWAGTETATEWMGYIEGAIQSGERVAEEVDKRLRELHDV